MTIDKKLENNVLKVAVSGRLDTTTAPTFEEDIKSDLKDVTELNIDFAGLEYISSAGLRVLLSVQKIMNKQGSMKISNVIPEIMEVFDITGFTDILTIA